MIDTSAEFIAAKKLSAASSQSVADFSAFAMNSHPAAMCVCAFAPAPINLYALAYEAARQTVRRSEIHASDRYLPSVN